MAAHDVAAERLAQYGCLPYRLGTQSAGKPFPGSAARTVLYYELKAALDPRGIIAPNRFGEGPKT